ncbi:MAG: hypothetical protein GY768_22355 [Planctomycetaceae bacterium]|nr:hypothetical protein [Planctomycetaceae bacterium]
MTSGYIRQCPLGKGPGTKNREALSESMTQSDEWQRRYSARSAHMLLPIIRTKHAYADVVQTPDVEEYSQFQETYDLNALRAYVDRSPHRSTNVELFAEALTLPPQARRAAKRSDAIDAIEGIDDVVTHLVENEKALHNFLLTSTIKIPPHLLPNRYQRPADDGA